LYKNKDEDKGCSLKDIVKGLKGASIRKLTEEEKDNLEGEIKCLDLSPFGTHVIIPCFCVADKLPKLYP
jgi:hypothetical protein